MGYKLKEIRKASQMTQEELAEKSGISRGTIVAIENNEQKIVSTKTLLKLADALNTTVDAIFFRDGV